MPLVHVYIRPKIVTPNHRDIFLETLPAIVASGLDSKDPEGDLSAQDITVVCFDSDETHRIMTHDIEIIIWASDFPQRKATLSNRASIIKSEIRSIDIGMADRDLTSFVWILLQPAAYEEFTICCTGRPVT